MPIHHLSETGAPLYSGGSRIAASVATLAALAAITANAEARTQGNEMFVDVDQSRWYWHDTSTLTSDGVLVLIPDDAPTAGRWLRCPGRVDLALAFTYAKADAAVLLTLQAGQRLFIRDAYWKVTTTFSGGAASAIGISSGTVSGATTKGDILGGAAGDIAAALVSTGAGGFVAGTAGATMDTVAHLRTKVLVATDTVRFDRITSAFTAGVGEAHIICDLVLNAGA